MIYQMRHGFVQSEWINCRYPALHAYSNMPTDTLVEDGPLQDGHLLSSLLNNWIDCFTQVDNFEEPERILCTNCASAPVAQKWSADSDVHLLEADVARGNGHPLNRLSKAESECLAVHADGAMWALSPYSELDNRSNVLVQSPLPYNESTSPQEQYYADHTDSNLPAQTLLLRQQQPEMVRQSSLSIALEVLGDYGKDEASTSIDDFREHVPDQLTPLTDLPVSMTSRQRSVSWCVGVNSEDSTYSKRARVVSADATSSRECCIDEIESLLQEALSTNAADVQGAVFSCGNTASYLSPGQASTGGTSLCIQGELTRSQGVGEAPGFYVEDKLLGGIVTTVADQKQNQKVELEAVTKALISDHCYSASRGPAKIAPALEYEPVSNSSTDETPSTSSCTPAMQRSNSYVSKRKRNNHACRESRKRKKLDREIAEERVELLTVENQQLRDKIAVLEVEVQETRGLLLDKITKK